MDIKSLDIFKAIGSNDWKEGVTAMNCAFCGLNNEQLTREHVIPDGFIRGMNKEVMTTWSDKAPVRAFKGDIVIKDVCAKCNNGVLSTLDNYAFKTITEYNGKINKNTKKMFFKYDFDKMSRWLLKILYNSARSSGSIHDSNVYKECTNYILRGGTCKLDFSVYMQFIDLKVNKSKDDLIYHFDKKSKYSIDHFRISPFHIKEISTYNCTMRSIIINSFVFFVIVYTKNATQEEKVNIEDIFKKRFPKSKKLMEETKKFKLSKENTFWIESFLNNIQLRDNFLEKREIHNIPELSIVQISKEELQKKNYQQIIDLIKSKRRTKDSTLDYFQKFDISISGYDEDSKELWEITEFREYVKGLIDFFPDIIWFLNLKAGFFPALVFAYVNTNNNLKKSDVEKVVQLQTKCFEGINEMTHSLVLDHSYNNKITELFTTSLFNILDIK